MRNFFLKTNRMGFSQWEENDGELARQLWGDPEVTRWICASGRFRPDEITARLQKEIENGRKYQVQYWPVFCWIPVNLQAAAAFALIPRAGMNWVFTCGRSSGDRGMPPKRPPRQFSTHLTPWGLRGCLQDIIPITLHQNAFWNGLDSGMCGMNIMDPPVYIILPTNSAAAGRQNEYLLPHHQG